MLGKAVVAVKVEEWKILIGSQGPDHLECDVGLENWRLGENRLPLQKKQKNPSPTPT